MDKAFQIQKQVRDNAKALNNYMTDLQNWEAEMKRKEAALNGAFEQDLPPVRSKIKKEKAPVVKKKSEPKIRASDYQAWEKFDADKACEDIDMAEVGPMSLDSKKSQEAKMEKLREEALYEKERGNNFVKQEKWDDAIKCYNRAIELVKDDAIYYANRGLCYLKKDSLHQAEKDCSEALRLDPTYVKAYQRRATAREKLGSLRSASQDLSEVLRLEPHNKAAKQQLEAIKLRMGTKGSKSKSSPVSTPTIETKPEPKRVTAKPRPNIIEIEDSKPILMTAEDKWRDGVGENITVLRPVKKPPHLRSKRPLKPVPIQEITLGKTSEKQSSRIKIIEIDSQSLGDNKDSAKNDITLNKEGNGDCITLKNVEVENNPKNEVMSPKNETTNLKNDKTSPKNDETSPKTDELNVESSKIGIINKSSPESMKLVADEIGNEKTKVASKVSPMNSVQFMAEWNNLKGFDGARGDYLSIIEPRKLPGIFENALESDVFSSVLQVLERNKDKFTDRHIAEYLLALTQVKRFSALAMFLSSDDKLLLTKLLEHCKSVEKCDDNFIADLKNKYEL